MSKESFRQYGGSNTPTFSLNGTKTYCRVVSVLDGDTIKVIIPIFNNYYKFNVRLNGIDTYEIKGKNKELGLKGRNRLFELITNKQIDSEYKKNQVEKLLDEDVYLIWLECLEFDKYGRLLGNLYNNENNEQNFSEILINEKLGLPYDGGTKMIEK